MNAPQVELEWCGQRRARLYPDASILAQKFLLKVADVLAMKRAAAGAGAAALGGGGGGSVHGGAGGARASSAFED